MSIRIVTLGEGTNYPLQGILTLPNDRENPVPAVVFVHGSGSSNMDERVGKLTPFRDLAEGFAQQGIASLRYNKRSFTHPLKLVKKKGMTVWHETIEDAILAAELLRSIPDIDPQRIFIAGHSMGAMLAPRIDAEGGNFRGMILMAGSPRNMDEILMEQLTEMMAQSGKLTRMIVQKQANQFRDAFEKMYDMSDEEAKAKKMGGGTSLYYFKDMAQHPVSSYLENSTKPVLVMQGGKDFQVKAEVDYILYQQLLQNHPDATFHLYKNLNHCFVPSIYGRITKAKQEYSMEQHIGDKVIGDMATWIHNH